MAHPWQATVQDHNGNIMPLAEITVRNGGPLGSIANIYSDDAGTPKPNPFDAEANGLVQFWAETGTYYIEGSLSGQTTDGWYISLGGGSAVLTVAATEAIAPLKAVTSAGALCDVADVDSFAGISQAAAAIGEGVNLIRSGLIVDGSWTWTPDQPIFIADGGALTQVDPGNSRRVAWAESATSITVDTFPTGTVTGGAGKEGLLVMTGPTGLLDPSIIDFEDVIADPAADPASDNEGLFPALDADGFLPSEFVPIEDISTDEGGAGNENQIVRTDDDGDIPESLLGKVVNRAKELIADGAITAGDAVGISGDGTVKKIQVIEGTYASSDEGTLASLVGDYGRSAGVCYDKVNNCFVFMYRDEGNSSYPTVVAATIVGTTLTFGTPVVIESEACREVLLYFHEKTGQVIATYMRASDGYLRYNILSISGTAVTPNTTANITTENSGNVWSLASDPTNALLVVSYAEGGGNYAGKMLAGTVFSTTITFGSVAAINGTSQCFTTKTIFDTVSDRYIVFFADFPNDDIEARTLNISGTNITFNAIATVFNGTGLGGNNIHADIDPSTGVFVVGYNATATIIKYSTGTVSGTNVSVNASNSVPETAGHAAKGFSGIIYDNLSDQWILAGYQTGANNYASIWLGTMASEVLTLADPEIEDNGYSSAANFRGLHLAFDPDTQQVIYLMQSAYSHYNPLVINPASSVSNIGTYCGFAKTSAADTEKVIVDTQGDINASQSGLTINVDYYLAGDGSISEVDTGYPAVGRSWSATKLEITNGRIDL
jgi:hypothetical protein